MKKASTFTLDEKSISNLTKIAEIHKRSKSNMLEILIKKEYESLIKNKTKSK
jgi:hypothetical protein